jgi:hypothetical protein
LPALPLITPLLYLVNTSDESEPSWLELKDLQLGSARLGSARDLFHFSSELKIDQNELNFWLSIEDLFVIINLF